MESQKKKRALQTRMVDLRSSRQEWALNELQRVLWIVERVMRDLEVQVDLEKWGLNELKIVENIVCAVRLDLGSVGTGARHAVSER